MPVTPVEVDLSIIIVSWNTRDLLRKCLQSIARETRSPHEVIVIDNASTDDSATMLSQEFPRIVLIANISNRGFAAANNQGLRRAVGRRVLLLNPDTVILDGAIDRCLAFMNENDDIACLGCQVWEHQDRIQRTCFRFPSLRNDIVDSLGLERFFPSLPIFQGSWMLAWDRRTTREVDVVSGMFMLVSRKTLELVGVLDEAYFVYGEEVDWCYRMSRAGLRRVFWPSARILHVDGGGKSTSQQSVAMYVQLQRSMLIFSRKHYGAFAHALLRGCFAARMLLRLPIGVLRWLTGSKMVGRRLIAQSYRALQLNLTESVSQFSGTEVGR